MLLGLGSLLSPCEFVRVSITQPPPGELRDLTPWACVTHHGPTNYSLSLSNLRNRIAYIVGGRVCQVWKQAVYYVNGIIVAAETRPSTNVYT
ncbi:hypothetical protein C8Q77DRAFT_1135465 [Trametes polyzona]|nr:hypothetical protein C8Q77DRAFT_1135465 [Trametes polyzona]